VISPCLGRSDVLNPSGLGEFGDMGGCFGQPLSSGGLQGQLPLFAIAGLDRHVYEALCGRSRLVDGPADCLAGVAESDLEADQSEGLGGGSMMN